MAFFLLPIAVFAFVVRGDLVHVIAMALHLAAAGVFGWKILPRQPLGAMAVWAYAGMYALNPLAINLGIIQLEPGADRVVLYTSNSLIMIGLDLLMIGIQYFRRHRLDAIAMPPVLLPAHRVSLCIISSLGIAFAAMAVLIVIVSGMGVDVFTIRKSFRVSYGGQNKYYLMATYATMIVPLAAFLLSLRPFRRQALFLSVIAALLVLHFMVFRVRTLPVAVVLAYGIGLLCRGRVVALDGAFAGGPIPPVVRRAMLAGIPLLVVLGVGIKYLRYSYSNQDMRIDEERVRLVLSHTFEGGDLGYAIFLRRAMELYPGNHGFLYGQSYYRLLLVPVPRALWPNKPENTQRIFAAALSPENWRKGVTIPPGIVGDLYLNFGVLGVFGMLVFGGVLAQERYASLPHLLFLSGAGLWIFHFVRGGFTNPVMSLIFVAVLSVLVSKFVSPEAAEVDPAEETDWHSDPALLLRS